MSGTVRFSCPQSFYDTFERKGAQEWTTHYCPGCGHGLVHKYIAEAIDDMGCQDQTIFVSPVGCAVFAYYYFDVGNVQVPHGRCPAVATAIKRAHPESLVIGYQGDGDLAAIGGNEILHTANRGENVTIFFVNNGIYGMTGGQMAPTSAIGMKTTTSPEGRRAENEGFPVKVCELLNTLDAPYYLERVAVGDPKHNHKARHAVRRALTYQVENRGFSLVEVLSPCPTGWKQEPVDAAETTVHEMTRLFPLGVFRDGHELGLGHPRLRSTPDPADVPAMIGAIESGETTRLPDHDLPVEAMGLKIAGFGGQGVLLLGLILSNAGMLARRQVSWIPSYGPEMRGGTANCSVTISDREIGSPIVTSPNVLVAMNGPSMERFAADVVSGGTIYYNASMIEPPEQRPGVTYIAVPANEIADRLGNPKVANMVMLGALLAGGCAVSKEATFAALPLAIKSRTELLELNREAIEAGMATVAVA